MTSQLYVTVHVKVFVESRPREEMNIICKVRQPIDAMTIPCILSSSVTLEI